jgi:molybdopterin-guanine dinucleotide biosynthesis protein
MNIFNFFKQINLTLGQSIALEQLAAFIENEENIFILKGYAGTGKTTLIKGVADYLNSQHKSFEVMAPSGRAAKVLRDKTGHGSTIHSAIYNLEAIETINANSKEQADHSVKYHFPIDLSNTNERVLIVDEASMISSKESNNELFDFGTNILLDDLLTNCFSSNKNNKIIFVGDPAQLPPVGDNNSCALDKTYFDNMGYSCAESILKEVKRQENNLVLQNATTIRNVLDADTRSELIFAFDEQSCIKLNATDIIDTYLDLFPNPEIGDGVILSFSNSQCYHYNMGIRETLFPQQKDILPGDLILINNNNYHTYVTELFNGDIAKVVNVSDVIISQSAPVYTNKGGNKEKIIVTLDFRKVTIRVPSYDGEIACYIIDNLLNSIDRDLTTDMMKGLYINFVMRFNEEQEKRKASGLKGYKVGSEEFKTALKNDPFYNALRVKYAYAITCHKAQGGEWDKVIVDYSGRVGLSNDALRWCYTATTRAINTLYTFNAPYFTSFSKLKFSTITAVGKIPQNVMNFESVKTSPFHNPDQHQGKSLMYWSVLEKLENTDFKIINVVSKGDFLERYTVENSKNSQFCLQASHKGSGHFLDPFKILNSKDSAEEQELEIIFNSIENHNYALKYLPCNKELQNLYSMMQQECQSLNISITNIEEQVEQYYVNYYLVTDAVCSYIQFYFNKKFQFSTAMPKSFQCDNDKKLIQLIEKLTHYAS